jgi:hypothetical protein
MSFERGADKSLGRTVRALQSLYFGIFKKLLS